MREGIKSHGLVGGILWNRRTGNLVGGHQRISQLDMLEESQDYSLDVDVIDVDESEEREINLLLNNPTAQGEFDEDKLAEVLEHLRDENRNVERTGWTMADVEVMLGDDFLEGAFAAQRDEEADVLGELASIRETGRAAEVDFFGGDDGELPPERISTTVPTPGVERDETGAPVGEPPKKDYTEELKRRKEEIMVENADTEDADYLITFVFDGSDVMNEFLRQMKLDPKKRYFDREAIEVAFGITLT